MYPTSFGDWALGFVLMVAVSAVALAVLNWIFTMSSSGRDMAERIALERFGRGEISEEELHLLLRAL